MKVVCPFCRSEYEHDIEIVKNSPNTIYKCYTKDCGLKYIIDLDEDWGSTIKTMSSISQYWAEDGSPLYDPAGTIRYPRHGRRS
jgi:hypothetical protein